MPHKMSTPVLPAHKRQRPRSRPAAVSSQGGKHWLIALGAQRVRILTDGGL